MANLFNPEYAPLTENTSNLTAFFAAEQRQKALTFAYMSGYWKALGHDARSDKYAKRAVYEMAKIGHTFERFSTAFEFTSWFMEGRR